MNLNKKIIPEALLKLPSACAPLALFLISKENAQRVVYECILHKWRPYRGMTNREIIRTAKKLKIKLKQIRIKRRSLKKIIKYYEVGTYLVSVSGHIFVIQNGIIIDPRHFHRTGKLGLNRIVVSIYRIY